MPKSARDTAESAMPLSAAAIAMALSAAARKGNGKKQFPHRNFTSPVAAAT
jgi:hypothetical protein